MNHRNLARPV